MDSLQKAPSPAISLDVLNETDLVDEQTACRIIGGKTAPIHRSSLWRGVNAGRYPKPIKVGPGMNRWRVSELLDVIARAAAVREVA
jgi:predicted DNA-binding transcriptional regulator AlpA